MSRARYAIVPTKGNRPEVLRQSVTAIGEQIQGSVFVPYNSEDDTLSIDANVSVIRRRVSPREPVNLSKMWNIGLNWAAEDAQYRGLGQWDVAIVNDDAIVPEGWFDAVSNGMRAVSAAAGCSGPQSAVYTVPGPVPLHTRLQGYAFMVAGELGLRANEDINWWFTDDWMDWESRKLGGMVMVQGFQVAHLHPNGQMTPEIHVQCAKDAQTFSDIYDGMRPW